MNLSYILVTRNRLDFLKITLNRLLLTLQADEEVVVIDGNSTDGSAQYLQRLFEEKKIHQYISEPDQNQAHGWNKAMLMAKGALIKKIIDDDVYGYDAIKTCKKYMLQHPEVDVVISNDLTSAVVNYNVINRNSRLTEYEKWRSGVVRSFTFSDVHMMIRRSSLSYIGIYHTGYINMDWEYALRISFLQANISYFTGYNALNVAHSATITSISNRKIIEDQGNKGKLFYEYPGDGYEISNWSRIKILIGKTLHKMRASKGEGVEVNLDKAYDHYYTFIELLNKSGDFRFIEKV